VAADSRQPTGILGRAVFYTAKLLLLSLLKVYFRVRTENRPRLDGGFVLVANHASLLDPLILGAVTPGWAGTHRVVFMMNSAMARSRLLGWFYRWNRVIPVAPQGGNKEALRAARDVLAAGEILAVFPEGGLSRDGQLLLGNPGAVSLGLARSSPVLPVGIVGTDHALPFGGRFPWPRKIVVRYGQPISVTELTGQGERKQRLASATVRIMREIACLLGQTAREDQLLPRRN
jgi:1-acyl-sn-glycerol-3-phosphate acyltransferase